MSGAGSSASTAEGETAPLLSSPPMTSCSCERSSTLSLPTTALASAATALTSAAAAVFDFLAAGASAAAALVLTGAAFTGAFALASLRGAGSSYSPSSPSESEAASLTSPPDKPTPARFSYSATSSLCRFSAGSHVLSEAASKPSHLTRYFLPLPLPLHSRIFSTV